MARVAVLACLACVGPAGPAVASISSGIGFDYQSGPRGQTWKGALGFVTGEALGGDLTIAAVRFDDGNVGTGFSGLANAGVPLLGRTHLRVIGARAIGDESYRSSRVRVGPEIALSGGRSLGIYFSHFEDNNASRLNSFGSELAFPIVRTLTGSGGLSYGTWGTGLSSAQGSAGLVWNPTRRVQVLGECALGRNVFTVSESSPAAGGLGHLPVPVGIGLGKSRGGQTTTEESTLATTGLVGFRVLIP